MEKEFEEIKSVNEELTLFLFKEEGLVYSNLSKRVYLLNALSVFIWLLLEEGESTSSILGKCFEQGNIQKDELWDVVEELNSLFQKGKLEEKSQEEEYWLDKIELGKPEGSQNDKTHYRLLDIAVDLEIPDPKLKNELKSLLAQFAIGRNDLEECLGSIHVRLIDSDDSYKFSMNGYEFSWKIKSERTVSFLLDRLRKLAVHFSTLYIAAHAAVLVKGGKCLFMPALSYSGKSTLSAALVGNGFQYYSDEIAVLNEDFTARPLPLGLGLKEGSWSLVEKFLPAIKETAQTERWDGVPMKYLSIDTLVNENGKKALANELAKLKSKVSHLIFPKYVEDTKTKLNKLSTPQALYALYEAGYTENKEMSKSAFIKMLLWLSELQKYSFEFSDLDDAALNLENLV